MESHDPLAVSFDAEVQDLCILSHEGQKLETCHDFLIKLDIKPLIHLLEKGTFSLNYCQTYQNNEQTC